MNFMRPHSPIALFSLLMVAHMCVLPFLVPHHRQPLTTFYSEWLAIAFGLMAASLLLRRSSWQPFRLPVVALVPLGIMVVLGVQVAVGLTVYWQQHFLVGLYLLWATLMVVLGAELRREFGLEKLVPVLAWAVLAGGLLGSAFVVMQIAGLDHYVFIVPRKGAGYAANLMQINHLANYLGLALASLLYLAATARIKTGWTVLLSMLLLFPLALTGQRMGWIYVVMLAVGCWLVGRNSASKSWRALWLIPGFITVQLLIPLLPIGGTPAMPTQRMVSGFGGQSIRLQLFSEAWQIFLAHPWLGAGFRQFGWQDFLMAEAYPGHTGWFHHAHNLVLHLMAETGLAGSLVMLVGLGYWLIKLRLASPSPARWWLYAMLAVLGVHSLLEYPLWYAYFLGLVALLLGAAEEKYIEWRMDLGQLLLAGIMVFGVFSLGNVAMHYTRLESWYTLGITGRINAVQLDRMLEDMSKIRRKSLLTPYIDLVIVRVLPSQPEFLEVKRTVSDQVMRFVPGAREVYSHVTLLMLNDQEAEAKQQLQRALIRHPSYANKYAIELLKMADPRIVPLLAAVLRRNGKAERQQADQNPRSGKSPEQIRDF